MKPQKHQSKLATKSPSDSAYRRRIIIIDDTESIHSDYEKILIRKESSDSETELKRLDALIFSEPSSDTAALLELDFELEHALQGQEGLAKVTAAAEAGNPFCVAFVDMRMPPGWDGLETIERIWENDPYIQVVISSAYSDHSWSSLVDRLGQSDRLLILRKPFDQSEVRQIATALCEKWFAEKKTRDLLETLERKVEKRTIELKKANERLTRLNDDLKISAHEAQCAARAKGRFLATMSHEIRTTLNGIMGASQMLNACKFNDESGREFASIIESSGGALMTIINDILDYSKYETGQLDLESVPFSLKTLAEDCRALLDSIVVKNEIEYEFEWAPEIPRGLLGDPARIRQVILNLLNNAFKFGKNGVVKLSVELLKKKQDHVDLSIKIIDHGIGMDEQTLSRLFSAFMQADSSTTREFGGTGLGLAICKLLADAMSAEIIVSSQPGEGSIFDFRISLAVCDHAIGGERRDVALAPPGGSDDFASYSGKRALLVDDNAVNCKLGKHFLNKFELDVELAYNGMEAVERATRSDFDIILMDLQMPEMDGQEATELIREHEKKDKKSPRVPIVALTANAFSEIKDICTAAGMDDFLTKPLGLDDLSRVLHRWVAKKENLNDATRLAD